MKGQGPNLSLIHISCELIADNGTVLRDTVLRHAADWALEEDFLRWLREENRFCNTLVDRIVTGCPAAQAPRLNAENGYEDALLDTAEPFGLWVIEGDEALSREFPAQKAGLPVKLVADHHPYKEQKLSLIHISKAVIFFIVVAAISIIQLQANRRKEVQQ